MIKLGVARKFIAILANVSLLFNSFVPFLLAVKPVNAQEAPAVENVIVESTPVPEAPVIVEVTPEITPEPIVEITPIVEVTPSPENTPTPEVTPSIDPVNVEIGVLIPSVEATISSEINSEPVVESTPEPTTIPDTKSSEIQNLTSEISTTPAPTEVINTEPAEVPVLGTVFEKICLTDEQIKDTTNEEWTINDTTGISETKGKVQLGVRYVYPQENKVSVTFKCLPKDESLRTTLKIQKVKTADLALPNTMGSVGEYAFDITTGMKDGDFEYDLTLPKPENSTAEISYIEKSVDEAKSNLTFFDINKINYNVEQSADTVKATGVDHFTIFIIVNPDDTTDNSVKNEDNGWTSNNSYAEFDNEDDYAEYGFPYLNIPINSIIEGIEVFIEGKTENRDLSISIFNKSNSDPDGFTVTKIADLTSSENNISLGGSIEKWGKTWISSDFDSNFKIRVDANSGSNTAYLDMVQVKVYYTSSIVWPTSWTPISGCNADSSDESPSQLDILGDASHSAAYFATDSNYLYLRERIEGNPSGTGMFTQHNWVVLNEQTGDNYYDYLFTLNGNSEKVEIRKNTVQSEEIDWSPLFNDPADNSSLWEGSTNTYARIDSADSGYYFVSWAIPKNITGFTLGTTPKFYFATSADANNYNKDHLNCYEQPSDVCGDGFVTGNEICDDGTNNGKYGYCNSTCTAEGPFCGDTITTNPPEECDGNSPKSCTTTDGYTGTQSCSSCLWGNCQTTQRCGDGVKNGREECDGSSGITTNYSCNATCNLIRDTGTLQIVKSLNPTSDSGRFELKIGSTTTHNIGNGGSTPITTVNTGNYTISEDDESGTNLSNYSSSISCSDGTNGTGTSLVVNISKNENVVCTFTNIKKGTIIIKKDMVGGTDNFNFTGTLNGSISTDLGTIQATVTPGQYTSTESTKTGWNLTNISCDDGNSTGNISNRTTTFNVEAGETVTCTFTNTKKSSIKVIKDSNPDDTQNFIFRLIDSNNTQIGFTELDDDNLPNSRLNNHTFNNLISGSYKIYEDSVSGWTLDNITCTNTNSLWSFENGHLNIDINPGEQAECTFTNGLDKGSLKAFKYEDKNNNQSQDSNETGLSGWEMKLYSGNGCSGSSLKTITTDTSGNVDFGYLLPGSYSIKETMKTGWKNSTSLCQNISIIHNDQKTIKFGNYKLGKIEGHKFYDKNGDSNWDNGEDYIEDWRIFIDQNHNGIYNSGEIHYHTNSNGYYKFENLALGNYTICEQMQPGWYNSTPICETTTITANDTDTIDFGNMRYGSINVCKVILDASGNIVNGSDLLGSNFSISGLNTSTSQGSPAGVLGTTTFTTPLSFNTKLFNSQVNNAECTLYSNLKNGNYYYGQESIPGSVWSTPKYNDGVNGAPTSPTDNFYEYSDQLFNSDSNDDNSRQTASDGHIVLNSNERNRTLIIINQYKYGQINVTKYNDFNNNGQKDEGEESMSGWDINLTNQESQTTNENGQVTFDKLLPGNYDLSEVIKEPWNQTNINCGEEQEIDNDNSYQIDLGAGEDLNCYIGNRLDPTATIAKFNNVLGDLSPGNSVEYKIKLNILDNDVTGFKVTDLLSNGFKYRLGTYRIYKKIAGVMTDITESIMPNDPTYNSPGVWELGNLKAGDELELTYIADISTDQHAGKYADLAWASGKAAYDESNLVLALGEDSTYVNGNFVGTQVPVIRSYQNATSAGVEKIENREGQVLGATTDLPGTGAATIWLIISSLLGIAGFSLLKISKKTMLTILLTLLSFGLLISPIKAVDNLVVRIEEPKSPINTKDIDLKFVALDTTGASITAKCFKKGPTDAGFSQFGSDIILTDGGNSSSCVLSSAINDNGSYQFYVTANSVVSNTVNLDYKTSSPSSPVVYSKERINSCDYKIHFKTADDGGKTVKVEVYRSDKTSFDVNSETLVAGISIGSNQEYDITNSVPDCNKDYYFVIRSFDDAGNGSAPVGDSVVITNITNPTTTTTTDSVLAAIPVIGDNNIPKDGSETDQEIISDENQEGSILGTETPNPKSFSTQFQSFISRHKFSSALIALLVLFIIGYVVKRIGKKKR